MNDILEILNLSSQFQKLIKREIKIPYLDDYNSLSTYWYPHPPCLIPLFVGHGASYKGVVKHFFIERQMTFVDFELETQFFNEIARNEKQFIARMIIEMDMLEEGLTDEIREFGNSQNLNEQDLEDIDSFCEKYGNIPEEFNHLHIFSQKLPFRYCFDLNDYNGDFPSSYRFLNNLSAQKACSFEISKEEFVHENLSEWLINNSDKKSLFYDYLKEYKLSEAWLTLNSTGWLLSDVALALDELKRIGNDPILNLVADNWIQSYQNSNAKNGDKY